MRGAFNRAEWPECEYCQARERRLYELPIVRPMGELAGLAVCVYCYIRLAGRKPRLRTAALAARSSGSS